MDDFKICKNCKKNKSITEYTLSKGYYLNKCKVCINTQNREKYRIKHPIDKSLLPRNDNHLICTSCKLEKHITEFGERKDCHARIRKQCQSCFLLKKREYKNQNKNKIKHQEKIRFSTIKNDPAKYSIYMEKIKKYKNDNRDKINLSARLPHRRKSKREYHKQKEIIDINFKLKNRLRSRFFLAIKKNYKRTSIIELLGCSIEEFKVYISNIFKDGMSWDNYGKWHIDHIIPCSHFDLTILEEQVKCFHYTNLQPLWAKENLKKGSSLDWNKNV